MNPIILTKVSKHLLIGSTSAYLSFASQQNPIIQRFFYYSLAGVIVAIVIVLFWEGREAVSYSSENDLSSLLNSVSTSTASRPKRNYFLSNQARLELVLGLIVISVCTLAGSL